MDHARHALTPDEIKKLRQFLRDLGLAVGSGDTSRVVDGVRACLAALPVTEAPEHPLPPRAEADVKPIES